jgi:hypothetical protein
MDSDSYSVNKLVAAWSNVNFASFSPTKVVFLTQDIGAPMIDRISPLPMKSFFLFGAKRRWQINIGEQPRT